MLSSTAFTGSGKSRYVYRDAIMPKSSEMISQAVDTLIQDETKPDLQKETCIEDRVVGAGKVMEKGVDDPRK